MDAKHTPGPWEDVGANKDGERCIYGADDSAVAATIPVGNPDSKLQRSEANARLIAAAPMLLEALRGLVDEHVKRGGVFDEPCGQSEQSPQINAAIAAIAAATITPEPIP